MTPQHNTWSALGSGAAIGTLGGLIGLGGAEFRLPLLIGIFGFGALEAIILNKALSLVVVLTALPFRAAVVPFNQLFEHWNVISTLLSGSIAGAWYGAGWCTKIQSKTLYKVIALLLVFIAGILLVGHDTSYQLSLNGWALVLTGSVVGFGIGVVAALLGVAGGELLIPTIIILFSVDFKLAGSLSLVVSLPTMIASFTRYSRNQSFQVISVQRRFIAIMATGSIVGSYLGGKLLGIIPTSILLPLLAIILLVSAVKVWRHS